MDLQFLGFLRPFYMYNNNLYPKSSRNYVLLRAGLNKAGQSCPFGQKGWIGRPWLARPSKGHNFWNFLGINCCSTCKNVSNKPKVVDVYCFCLLFVSSGPLFSFGYCLEHPVDPKFHKRG